MASLSPEIKAASCTTNTSIPSIERRGCFGRPSNDSIAKCLESSAFVQITFIALGVSSLLPWNAITTALPFFLERLRGTPMYDNFASWLTLVLNVVGLVAIGFAAWAGEKFTRPSSFSALLITLISSFAMLAAVSFITLPPSAFFAVVLAASSLMAAACGFLQTSIIELAPKYGSSAIASYMTGSALSGVGVSALQVTTAYTSSDIALPGLDPASCSAAICFMSSAAILGLTLVLCRTLGTDDFDPDQAKFCNGFDLEATPSEHTQLLRQQHQPILCASEIQETQIQSPGGFHGCDFAIFYGGVITTCLFPAITATIQPVDKQTNPLVFNAIHFLVFNVADLMGRPLASLYSTSNTALVLYSLLRTGFVPFFIACNVVGSSLPPIITSDITYLIGLFLLGLTCGHGTTLSLVVSSERGGGKATRLTQFWMMAGFIGGGAASFGVRSIL